MSLCTQYDWQELVVCDVLYLSHHYPASLLEQRLVTPVWVKPGELRRDSVVLSHPHRVGQSEVHLLVNSAVPYNIIMSLSLSDNSTAD